MRDVKKVTASREANASYMNQILPVQDSFDIIQRDLIIGGRIASFYFIAVSYTHLHRKVLMAYHNIYQSWAWLGGHADGNADLKQVILKEIEEESGLKDVRFVSEDIFSLEILTVAGHEKRGEYISSHLHLNVTYLLEASTEAAIRIKEDENSQIGWINVDEIKEKSTEKWFVDRIYSKLCEKVVTYEKI